MVTPFNEELAEIAETNWRRDRRGFCADRCGSELLTKDCR
jgi:hypothetical protein